MLKIDFSALREEWEAAPHGCKKAVIARAARMAGVSSDTVYREFRRRFGKSKVIRREMQIPGHLIDMIADMKIKGMAMSLEERELSTEICIERLLKRGVADAKALTVSTVNRRLRAKGFRMRDPKIRYEAKFANHEVQMDFSRSKYFQVWKYDEQSGSYILKVSKRELHYKKGDNRFRMWLVQYKDSYSRLRLSRGYAATGESAIMGIDFLNFVWNRDEDEHPVRYLPVNFKSDNGAFEKRAEVRAMFDALTVERKRSRPHNKDSNQKVETGWKILWRKFELPLAMDLIDANIKTITLSDYNDLLHEFLTREQFESHPSLGTSKGEVYRQSIMTYPPREIDIDLREIACRVEHRSVKQDLIVRYQNEDYEAPLYAMDQRIRIYKNMAGELMGELIEEDRKPFLLKPYRVRDYDDFENRPHRTYRQEREQILKSKEREAKQGNKAAEVSFQEGKRIFMKPETNEAVPNSPFTESDVASDAFGSVYAAKVYIGSQLPDGQTYKDVAFAFDDMLLITTSKQAINTVLAELNHKPKMRALK